MLALRRRLISDASYSRAMAARTRCLACGGRIDIDETGPTDDVIAVADQFFHRGCIEAAPVDSSPGTPAYHIPRDW